MKNYYKILGLRITATEAEIKQAYRKLAKTYHPDLNRDNPSAADTLADVNEAYEVLSDSEKRQKYNKDLGAAVLQGSGSGSVYGNTAGFSNNDANGNPQNNTGGNGSNRASGFKTAQQSFSRFDAAAAATQRIQIENAIKNAYNEGYAKGFSDSKAKSDIEINRANITIEDFRRKVSDLEKEIHYFEQDYEKQSSKLAEANSKVDTLTKQLNNLGHEAKENDGEADQLKMQIEVYRMQAQRAKEKHDSIVAAVEQRDRTIEDLNEQIDSLKSKLAELEEYSLTRERDDDVEQIIQERENKLKQIKKQIKKTHYGTLGAYYWASEEEIKSNYNKLVERLKNKARAGDTTAQKKFQALEEAFFILSDANRRKVYNSEISITEEDILRERQLEEEYYKIIDRYNADKDEREFWDYLDELMMMAQSGDCDAQNELGELYYNGERIAEDIEQAVYWFKESAKHQHPAGLYNLGLCYYYGEGMNADKVKGEGFIKLASKLGNKEATNFLKQQGN